MSVSGRRPRKFGAAVGAAGFGGLSRLFSLVAQEVTKGRELAAVAAVFPALRLGPALDDADMAACVVMVRVLYVWRGGCHHRRHRVHDWIVGDGSDAIC